MTRGRKTKLTPDVLERITRAIELGATYEMAAQYGGITFETFRVWRAKNAAFSDAIKEAEGKAVVGWLDKIETAATEGSWQAAAWKLERRYPREYGRTDKAIEVTIRHYEIDIGGTSEDQRNEQQPFIN